MLFRSLSASSVADAVDSVVDPRADGAEGRTVAVEHRARAARPEATAPGRARRGLRARADTGDVVGTRAVSVVSRARAADVADVGAERVADVVSSPPRSRFAGYAH